MMTSTLLFLPVTFAVIVCGAAVLILRNQSGHDPLPSPVYDRRQF